MEEDENIHAIEHVFLPRPTGSDGCAAVSSSACGEEIAGGRHQSRRRPPIWVWSSLVRRIKGHGDIMYSCDTASATSGEEDSRKLLAWPKCCYPNGPCTQIVDTLAPKVPI